MTAPISGTLDAAYFRRARRWWGIDPFDWAAEHGLSWWDVFDLEAGAFHKFGCLDEGEIRKICVAYAVNESDLLRLFVAAEAEDAIGGVE